MYVSPNAADPEKMARQGAFFEERIRPHEGMLKRMALRFSNGNQSDAEDLFQMTMVKAIRGMDTFRGEAKITTWLVRIMFNENGMRHRKNAPIFDLDNVEADNALQDSVPIEITKGLGIDLKAALQKLSAVEKEAFTLCVIEGGAGKDVSDRLGITLNALKSRTFHARQALKEDLKLNAWLEPLRFSQSAPTPPTPPVRNIMRRLDT